MGTREKNRIAHDATMVVVGSKDYHGVDNSWDIAYHILRTVLGLEGNGNRKVEIFDFSRQRTLEHLHTHRNIGIGTDYGTVGIELVDSIYPGAIFGLFLP